MGWGQGIRTRSIAADLVHRHAVKLIVGDAVLGAALYALGRYLSR